MSRRIRYGGGALALAAAYLLVPATPAAADLAEPAGTCQASGAWQDGGLTVDSASADPDDVIEIPRADQVAWTAQVVGPQPGDPRPIAGKITLRLPPPLGEVTVNSWEGSGVEVESSGTEAYDLPAVVPAGVVFTLRAEHREQDQVFCTGAAKLRIAGGPFDSPLVWVGLAGTALSGGLLLLAGRAATPPARGGRRFGRMLAGALLGAVGAWFAALALLLFGVLALASPVLTAAPLAGAVLGTGWARWSPLGRQRAVPSVARVG